MLIGYIDPSVVTYVTQAVVGVIIAIGAFVGVYIKKVRKKVNSKLKIDENKNMEGESDDILIESKNDKKRTKRKK